MSNLQYPWEREMEDQFERNGCDPGDFNFYLEVWQASNDPYTGGDFDLAGQDGPTTLYSICEYIETWLDQGTWIGDDAFDPHDGTTHCQIDGETKSQFVMFKVSYGGYEC